MRRKIEREKQIEDLKEEVHDLKEKLIELDTIFAEKLLTITWHKRE